MYIFISVYMCTCTHVLMYSCTNSFQGLGDQSYPWACDPNRWRRKTAHQQDALYASNGDPNLERLNLWLQRWLQCWLVSFAAQLAMFPPIFFESDVALWPIDLRWHQHQIGPLGFQTENAWYSRRSSWSAAPVAQIAETKAEFAGHMWNCHAN